MLIYPAVLYPADEDGIWGCAVPDHLINASGTTKEAAIEDAMRSMNELLADATRDAQPFPEPSDSDEIDLDGGTLVFLQAPQTLAA